MCHLSKASMLPVTAATNGPGLVKWIRCSALCRTCSLVQKGYTVLHVDDVYARAYVTPERWMEPPPAFREVTADNLKFDLEDALKMQKRIMGCHNPPELVAQYRRVVATSTLRGSRTST